ncbi:MAG: ADP-ribosylglycohydrolase family protein [Chloroflexota bacterium]
MRLVRYRCVAGAAPRFDHERPLVRGEGGGVYAAEQGTRFYIVVDECALAETHDDHLYAVYEFDDEDTRRRYVRERGWIQPPDQFERLPLESAGQRATPVSGGFGLNPAPVSRVTSEGWLAWLLDIGAVRIERAPLLSLSPPALAEPRPGALRNRAAGMLLGLAIGDALGNTTESRLPDERAARSLALTGQSEIRDYLPNRHAGHHPVGLPSDDTQLAFWTLDHLLEHGRVAPSTLARRFLEDRVFGIGQATADALSRVRDGVPWYEAGSPSAGNGALMRVAPVILPHLARYRQPATSLWADAVIVSMITHNDAASNAACVALVQLLWHVLSLEAPPEPAWWVETFCAAMAPLEGNGTEYAPRGGPLVGTYRGPIHQFAREQVLAALDRGDTVVEAQARWYSGAFLLETIPTVLLLLARHGGDPEEAIVRAVNDTRDNDTIAAIVGAAVGALHGEAALPRRWVAGLCGRVVATGPDNAVFELVRRAVETWCPADGAGADTP